MTRPPVPAIRIAASVALALGTTCLARSAGAAPAVTRGDALRELAARSEKRLAEARPDLYRELIARGAGGGLLEEGFRFQIMFLGPRGKPFAYGTENADAASTVATDLVYPGGGFGFSLTGAATPFGQIAVWDAGAVRASHDELVGRVVQIDSPGGNSSHATHVSGTLIAAGVDPAARGMSYEGRLHAYDWNNDTAEMATAAAGGLRISNHSYGFITGWRFGAPFSGDWGWWGDVTVSPVEDYGFGFYWQGAADWDQIAHDAPYYLICGSAGNDRNDDGPGPGGEHWFWDPAANDWALSTATRDPDGGADGYDCISWDKTAKNILTVGAVEDIPGGWTQPSDVVMTSFSGWGPTDDGRIKPDLVANGRGLYSCTASDNSSYSSFSGTSMASPNLAGSLNLLVDHFRATHGTDPLAATMKAILVQSANEAGAADGPDYEHGWGLLSTLGAAQLIQADASDPGRIFEATLSPGAVDEYYLTQLSTGPVRLTMAWTDPPGAPPADSLDPPDLMLVNDLDLRLEELPLPARVAFLPWVLDPADPGGAATTGDNFRDPVEQIDVASLSPGEYVVRVSHKGSLDSGLDQGYSLVCSAPLSTTPPPAVGVDELPLRSASSVAPAVRPNPFRESTSISFRVGERSPVSLRIFDARGRVVRVLETGRVHDAGTHRLTWDGRDDDGRPVPAGVYFSRIEAGGRRETRKLVLVRGD